VVWVLFHVPPAVLGAEPGDRPVIRNQRHRAYQHGERSVTTWPRPRGSPFGHGQRRSAPSAAQSSMCRSRSTTRRAFTHSTSASTSTRRSSPSTISARRRPRPAGL
jgi:hypothetical protein